MTSSKTDGYHGVNTGNSNAGAREVQLEGSSGGSCPTKTPQDITIVKNFGASSTSTVELNPSDYIDHCMFLNSATSIFTIVDATNTNTVRSDLTITKEYWPEEKLTIDGSSAS